MAGWSWVLPLVILGLSGGAARSEAFAEGVILFCAFGVAMAVGAQFPLANLLEPGTASRCYTADFLGAALGGLLSSTLLLPAVGVLGVGLISGALNLMAALLFRGKRIFA